MDLSDNQIQNLGNFARLNRLVTLLLNNNPITRVAPDIGTQLPKLETLILTNCKVASLTVVDNIGTLRRISACGDLLCSTVHPHPNGLTAPPPWLLVPALQSNLTWHLFACVSSRRLGWRSALEFGGQPSYASQELPTVRHPPHADSAQSRFLPCEAKGTAVVMYVSSESSCVVWVEQRTCPLWLN